MVFLGVGILLGLLFGGAGAYVLWGRLRIVQLKRASRSWPSVTGTVTRSEAEQMGNMREVRRYVYHIRYEYTIEGTTYIGKYDTDIVPGTNTRNLNMWTGKSHVQKLANQYPVGVEVDVAYDPDDPRRAVVPSLLAT